MIISAPGPGHDGFGHRDAGRVFPGAARQDAIVGKAFRTVFEAGTREGLIVQLLDDPARKLRTAAFVADDSFTGSGICAGFNAVVSPPGSALIFSRGRDFTCVANRDRKQTI